MSNTKLSKILWALIPIVIAIISIFVISRYTTSQGFYEPFTDSLDDKRNTVLEMTAASTAASAAISFLPGDNGTPIAQQLVKLNTGFLIVIAALMLEKYLLVLTGHVAFSYLIPIACVMFAGAILFDNANIKRISTIIASKILVFSLAIFFVVPLSVKASDLIEQTYEGTIQSTIEDASNTTNTINDTVSEGADENEGWLSKQWSELTTGIKAKIDKLLGDAERVVNNLLEALAVMVVTSCLLPILVLILILWLSKIILGVNIDIKKE